AESQAPDGEPGGGGGHGLQCGPDRERCPPRDRAHMSLEQAVTVTYRLSSRSIRRCAMRLNSLTGVVERRLLVNYRVDADAAARLLPVPLRPQLVRGWAVAGICLLRLGSTRPRWSPA